MVILIILYCYHFLEFLINPQISEINESRQKSFNWFLIKTSIFPPIASTITKTMDLVSPIPPYRWKISIKNVENLLTDRAVKKFPRNWRVTQKAEKN